MKSKAKYFALLVFSLSLLIGGCLEEKKKDAASSTFSTDIPEIYAACKYSSCVGTNNGRKSVVFLTDANDEIVAAQLGTLFCGDHGTGPGVACSFKTKLDSWVTEEGDAITQIPAGSYQIQMLVDVNGNVNSLNDIANFKAADNDVLCFKDVTITMGMTSIDWQNYICIDYPN